MMAFFLLMWLLGSTTEGDKKGIADCFQSPLKVAMLGGSGSGDSSSVVKGGGKDLTRQTGQVKTGEVEAKKRSYNLKVPSRKSSAAERRAWSSSRPRSRTSPPTRSPPWVARSARHDQRRPAHPDRRRRQPPDVRQRQRPW